MMFDPNFDPLQDLEECKIGLIRQTRDIRLIAQGHNEQQTALIDLANQNRYLLKLIKQLQRDQLRLRSEVEVLRYEIHHTK
jgi:hypothetical protein